MSSDKLRLAVTCFELMAASVSLFAGSAFLFTALYGIVFPRGTIQLIPLVFLVGIALLSPGILLARDAARRLKVTHLGIIVVVDLLGALTFIFLVVSPSSDLISGWLDIACLNSFLLIVAFVAGHKVKKTGKVYSPRSGRELEKVLKDFTNIISNQTCNILFHGKTLEIKGKASWLVDRISIHTHFTTFLLSCLLSLNRQTTKQ